MAQFWHKSGTHLSLKYGIISIMKEINEKSINSY